MPYQQTPSLTEWLLPPVPECVRRYQPPCTPSCATTLAQRQALVADVHFPARRTAARRADTLVASIHGRRQALHEIREKNLAPALT